MSEKKLKHGLRWPADATDLQIEMQMIRKGGFVKKEGVDYGLGLPHHYEQMRKIIWPELDDQRWHQLCLSEIRRKNAKVTVLMGPGSSGKTHEAACNYLMEYYCFPNETCVLVSSTDLRGLELRVWGEIKSLHERAKLRFDNIPGVLVDSKHVIATDEIEEDKIRDLRRGIIAIPTVHGGKNIGLGKWVGIKQKKIRLIADEACFPAGTLVDTPAGKRKIEEIKPGDVVFNAIGASPVLATSRHLKPTLVKVKTRSGAEIYCTPNHAFFTNKGWKKACELDQSCFMLSTYEAMQIMRGDVPAEFERLLLSAVLSEAEGCDLQGLRKRISETKTYLDFKFLQQVLLVEVSAERPSLPGEVLHKGEDGKDSGGTRRNISERAGEVSEDVAGPDECVSKVSRLPDSRAKAGDASGEQPQAEGYGAQTTHSRRQWDGKDEGGDCLAGNVPRCSVELSHSNQDEGRERIPNLLQGGYGIPKSSAGGGGGRELAQLDCQKGSRCEENFISCGDWVDSCEVQESEDFGTPGIGEGGIAVYNLEVEGHPSFSVGGFLVHNSLMNATFLSAFANLDKNEDFQAIVLGNPIDFNDPLGKAAEPKDGWQSHLEPKKTECWDTRFMNGRCVNLVGLDSPNFDFPEDEPTRYKYLISREKIANTLSFFAENSIEYYSQCVGVMKVGGMERRVLTRDIIRLYEAASDTAFAGETTKIYFVDAAYGGDLCVGGSAEFGKDVNGKVVLRFGEPKSIPIVVGSGTDPEYQIANFVKQDCQSLNIPPQNMGHDATGRGSLGTALAVVWSNQTVPVESGGVATNRPVCNDLFIYDDSTNPPQKRLKLCNEHYDKRVTEFWFSMRYSVESAQIKNLPDDAIEDLVERKWDYFRGNKISVEPKSGRISADGTRKIGMKERIGRSPDHGDWACGILEMARRRGFQITKLGKDVAKSSNASILQRLAKQHESLLSGKQLQGV
jgi:hypothetical protein